LPTLDPRKTRDRRLAVAQNHLNVCSELAQQRPHNAFRLLEHCTEKMFGFDLLILIAFSEFDSRLNRFLAPKCEFV
jgi:hypothetical protein